MYIFIFIIFFRVLQARRDLLSTVCTDSALCFVLSDRKAPSCTFMTQMHTTLGVDVAHANNALLYNISSSLPASFSSCTATCSDLAGFQCALIDFFPLFFLLQNLILMPLGHNTVPVVLHRHGEQFSDFLVYRRDLLFPPTFTAIIYSTILSHQLFSPKPLINMPDCLPVHFCVYHPSSLAHKRPPELSALPLSHGANDDWTILHKANTASIFQTKHCTHTMSFIMCVHTIIHNCALSQ